MLLFRRVVQLVSVRWILRQGACLLTHNRVILGLSFRSPSWTRPRLNNGICASQDMKHRRCSCLAVIRQIPFPFPFSSLDVLNASPSTSKTRSFSPELLRYCAGNCDGRHPRDYWTRPDLVRPRRPSPLVRASSWSPLGVVPLINLMVPMAVPTRSRSSASQPAPDRPLRGDHADALNRSGSRRRSATPTCLACRTLGPMVSPTPLMPTRPCRAPRSPPTANAGRVPPAAAAAAPRCSNTSGPGFTPTSRSGF